MQDVIIIKLSTSLPNNKKRKTENSKNIIGFGSSVCINYMAIEVSHNQVL